MTAFVGCLSLFFAGMVNMNSTLVKQEATYKRIAELSKSNDYGLTYATICFLEEGHSKAMTALAMNYGSNFSGHEQIIPAAFDSKTNEMKDFEAGFGEGSMRTVHIGNLSTYTNQKALHRFETAWINVYDNDTFDPHVSHGNSNGFVFIPDFYADELIEGSDGAYQCYNDLLPDKDPNGNLTDFQYLSASDGDTKITWSIVGIYHAKGFNDQYWDKSFAYNDGHYGEAINSFGAPFLIAYGSSLASSVNGLAVFSTSKQYSVEQKIKTIAYYDEEKTSSFTFYSAKNGTLSKMDGYSSVQTSFILNGDVPVWYFVFMALAIVSTVVFFFLARDLSIDKPWLFLCLSALGPFAFSLVGSLCANFLGSRYSFLYSFFSYYFGIFTLLILGIAIGWFLFKIAGKRREADEE